MKIKNIISRTRRDFRATYVCEHCDRETEGSGYDDSNFHDNVIPDMKCGGCGKKGGEDYEPRATKYHASQTV